LCGFVRDFLEQLSSKQETVDESALDEELRQVRLLEDCNISVVVVVVVPVLVVVVVIYISRES